jgi:SNF2 family DNA or RNA helicase
MILDIHKFNPPCQRLVAYRHQWEAYQMTRELQAWGFFWEMGTGKSKPIIDTAAWLFSKCEIDGLLIFSDKGCYLNWYYDEIPKHMPGNIPHRTAYWGSQLPRDMQKAVEDIMVAQDDMLDILCINTESLSYPRGLAVVDSFLASHYVLGVVDESTSIKNVASKKWKNLIKRRDQFAYRRILTGTPMEQGPLDLYAQLEFLKKEALGFKTFVEFRSYFADMITIPIGRAQIPKVVRYKNTDVLTRSVLKLASRVTKSECLDLPEKLYETLYVEMTDSQRTAYETMRDQAVIMLEQGLVTAVNGLTLITKLHQICQGHVKDDEGNIVDFESGKIPIMLDLIEKLEGKKVIIWCAFQRDVERVYDALAEKYKDTEYYPIQYYGKTSDDDRTQNKDKFLTDPNCMWWVGTAASGGKGLNLQSASHNTIYYSNTFKLGHRLQSEDRNHRIGQTENVTYYDLAVRDTVDIRVIRALKMKRDVATEVMDTNRLLSLILGQDEFDEVPQCIETLLQTPSQLSQHGS